MNLNNLKPKTQRKSQKRVGRGGKKGTFSGKGTKGQKARSGSSVRPGFRGGDNRIWQLFPKQRGASKKPGNSKPHKKHRYFQHSKARAFVLDLDFFNQFNDNELVTPEVLMQKGFAFDGAKKLKVLANGELKKKVKLEGFLFSTTAKTKAEKSGATISN